MLTSMDSCAVLNGQHLMQCARLHLLLTHHDHVKICCIDIEVDQKRRRDLSFCQYASKFAPGIKPCSYARVH